MKHAEDVDGRPVDREENDVPGITHSATAGTGGEVPCDDPVAEVGSLSTDHIDKLEALRDLGVDQFAGYFQHDNKEETLRVYGEHVIPALKGSKSARV
jgi:hypothetical protein